MGGLRIKEGQFSLFKRGSIWYYWTYDKYGKRRRFSTGEKKRPDAFDFCVRRMQQGELVQDRSVAVFSRAMTLSEFGKDFWSYDTCPIIQAKVLRGGHFSKKLAVSNQGLFDNHIKQHLGDYLLHELNRHTIETWLLNLPKTDKLSPKTSNHALLVLRQMLDHALSVDLIDKNPSREIKPLIGESQRRPAFTREEVQKLFSAHWANDAAYTACFLASRTGMRIGEVRALTREQIFPDYIDVNASWAEKEGRKSTKSGWSRIVPITEELYAMLMKYAPPLGGLLFSLNGKTPVSEWMILNALKNRMQEVGIDNPNLSFHSFRHFVNTRMIAADISGEKIRAIIGHESKKMTEHYAHLNERDLEAFRLLQEAI